MQMQYMAAKVIELNLQRGAIHHLPMFRSSFVLPSFFLRSGYMFLYQFSVAATGADVHAAVGH
jgi:hypothetical protein